MPPKRTTCMAYESSSSDFTSSSDSDSDSSDYDIAKKKPMKKRPCLAGPKAGTNQSSFAVPHIPDFTEQFISGAFSDCEVKCAGRVWSLHKLILWPRSKFFKAALTGNFSEANNGIVTLEEQNPDTLNDVLQHLYSGNLSHVHRGLSFRRNRAGGGNVWLPWYEKFTAIFILADFLVLPDLVKKCLDQLRQVNRKFKETVRFIGRCPTISGRFSERFGACAKLAYSLPLREPSTPGVVVKSKSKSATPHGSIRTIFVDLLLSTRLRNFKRVLKDLKTSEPQLLVDLLIAKA